MACRVEVTYKGASEVFSFKLPISKVTNGEFVDLMKQLDYEDVYLRSVDDDWLIPTVRDWDIIRIHFTKVLPVTEQDVC